LEAEAVEAIDVEAEAVDEIAASTSLLWRDTNGLPFTLTLC